MNLSGGLKQEAESSGCEITEIAANGMIILITVTCALLSRQLAAQAEAFQKEGGFTERLYKARVTARKTP